MEVERIARVFGVSERSIWRVLKQEGVAPLRKSRCGVSPEGLQQIRRMHVEEERTLPAIGRRLGVSRSFAHKYCGAANAGADPKARVESTESVGAT
jgi:hypothetical protein